MNHSTKKSSASKQINTKVHSELVGILYKQIIHMLWAEAFAASLIFYILWWHENRVLLGGWLAAMVFCTGIPRYYITQAYHKAAKEKKRRKYWEISLMILLLLTGFGWSFAGTVLLPANNHFNEFVVLFLLVGVAAAANPFYSPLKKMYAIFLIPTLFFSSIFLLMRTSTYAVFTGMAMLAFGMLMLITSIISSSLITGTLRLRFKNLALTKNLQKSNIRLENLASHDMLTNLPNRPFFYEKLDQTLVAAKENNQSFALLFLDLDKFKNVNDSLGHDAGDKLLLILAERLLEVVKPMDFVCRLGGDEFIVLLQDIKSPTDAAKQAQKICEALAVTARISAHDILPAVSIGISVYPDDGEDERTLIKKADSAMYDAKNLNKGGYVFFNKVLQS